MHLICEFEGVYPSGEITLGVWLAKDELCAAPKGTKGDNCERQSAGRSYSCPHPFIANFNAILTQLHSLVIDRKCGRRNELSWSQLHAHSATNTWSASRIFESLPCFSECGLNEFYHWDGKPIIAMTGKIRTKIL